MPNQLRSVFGRNFAILGEKRFSRFAVVPYEPKLVFDFPSAYYRTGGVDRSSLSDAMTFARAGSATYVDATGTIQTAAAGVPRAGHHVWDGSAWVNEGLLLESEARTNSLPYSTLGGAAVGVLGSGGALPTGWFVTNMLSGTVEVVSLADKNGRPNIRIRLNGMPTGIAAGIFFIGSTSVVTSTGQTWTGSAWVQKVAGSLTNINNVRIQVDERTAAGSFLGSTTVNFEGDIENDTRRVATRTMADATAERTNISVQVINTLAPIDITLDISATQFELGPTPSSYIPTSGSTVTRAAETLTIPAANLPWPAPEVIGPELVTNGTFDTDTTGWSAAFGSISWSDGKLLLTEDGADGSSARAYQIITTEVGKVYRITANVGAVSLGVVVIAASNSVATGGKPQVVASQNTSAELVFVAETTATYIVLSVQGATARTAEFDNISVREIKPLAVSIQMEGRVTYADEDTFNTVNFFSWSVDASSRLQMRLDTNSTNTGRFAVQNRVSGVEVFLGESVNTYTPGVLASYSVAGRFGSNFLNGAREGSALTVNTTPTALPDLSGADLNIGLNPSYNGTIRTFRMWGTDLGDTGIEEASA